MEVSADFLKAPDQWNALLAFFIPVFGFILLESFLRFEDEYEYEI